MSIVKAVLQEEYERLNSLMEKYRQEASRLPVGSVSIKEIRGHKYAYIARRIGGRISFQYIGKASSPEAARIVAAIQKRKEYESKMKSLRKDIKELERALDGRKI